MLDFKNWWDVLLETVHRFSCVMADFPQPQTIVNWSKKNIPKCCLYEPEGGIDLIPHVTLLYGLHTNEAKDVQCLLKKIKPFRIKLGKISKFTGDRFDVLKIEVEGSDLYTINKLLKTLPYTSNFPKYVPHCTLAYVEKNSCDHLVNSKQFAGKVFYIKELIFSSRDRRKTTIKL